MAAQILGILALCESREVELISSETLVFETEKNPNITRKEYALEVLSAAKSFVILNDRIENRAKKLNAIGIKPLDALHLASSEVGCPNWPIFLDRFLAHSYLF